MTSAEVAIICPGTWFIFAKVKASWLVDVQKNTNPESQVIQHHEDHQALDLQRHLSENVKTKRPATPGDMNHDWLVDDGIPINVAMS